MKIIIGGDVCPIGRNESLLYYSDATKSVQPFFEGFDFSFSEFFISLHRQL